MNQNSISRRACKTVAAISFVAGQMMIKLQIQATTNKKY
jgi:hypothetical protein